MAATNPPSLVASLAGQLLVFSTPAHLLERRFEIAQELVSQETKSDHLLAAIVVGSTALRRCSADADLDLVLITSGSARGKSFETRSVSNLTVEIERMTSAEAVALTAESGWIWELREAARIGCGVPVYDPAGFAEGLTRRAAALKPRSADVSRTLLEIEDALARIGRERAHWQCEDALRGCLDNLSLLSLLERPRRYQKAKWAFADLLHAGLNSLVEAMIDAYRINSNAESVARETIAAVAALVDTVHKECGAPSHNELLSMGYTPTYAEASYVSRTLADAEDMLSVGRSVEAQYVAKFAARLAIGQLSSPVVPESGLRTPGHQYRAVFIAGAEANVDRILSIALKEVTRLRETFQEH